MGKAIRGFNHSTRSDPPPYTARSHPLIRLDDHPKLDQQNILSHVLKSDLRTIINLVIRPQTFLKERKIYFICGNFELFNVVGGADGGGEHSDAAPGGAQEGIPPHQDTLETDL